MITINIDALIKTIGIEGTTTFTIATDAILIHVPPGAEGALIRLGVNQPHANAPPTAAELLAAQPPLVPPPGALEPPPFSEAALEELIRKRLAELNGVPATAQASEPAPVPPPELPPEKFVKLMKSPTAAKIKTRRRHATRLGSVDLPLDDNGYPKLKLPRAAKDRQDLYNLIVMTMWDSLRAGGWYSSAYFLQQVEQKLGNVPHDHVHPMLKKLRVDGYIIARNHASQSPLRTQTSGYYSYANCEFGSTNPYAPTTIEDGAPEWKRKLMGAMS